MTRTMSPSGTGCSGELEEVRHIAQSAICGEFRDRRSWTLPLPCRSFGGRADQSASQLRDKGRFWATTMHKNEELHINSFDDQSGTLRAG